MLKGSLYIKANPTSGVIYKFVMYTVYPYFNQTITVMGRYRDDAAWVEE